jgi:hypothetical protein
MRTATLTRRLPRPEDIFGTLGQLVTDSGLTLKTVERPWADNKPNESCILPEPGPASFSYLCKWGFSPKHGVNLYILQGVTGHTMIEIHPANVYQQLLGCLAPGLGVDLFPEGFVYDKETGDALESPQMGVTKSVGAVAMLEKDMQDGNGAQVDFTLTILWEAT